MPSFSFTVQDSVPIDEIHRTRMLQFAMSDGCVYRLRAELSEEALYGTFEDNRKRLLAEWNRRTVLEAFSKFYDETIHRGLGE